MYVTLVLAVLATLLGCGAQVLRPGRCPSVTPIPKLDIPKYVGIWYEQAHSRRWTGLELKCSLEYFESTAQDSFEVHSFTYSRIANKTFHVQGNANIKSKEGNQGILTIKVPDFGINGEVWVLGTDYTSYTVMWSCINADRLHFENVVVMTREPHPDNMVIVKAMGWIIKNKIQHTYMQYTSHRDCPVIDPIKLAKMYHARKVHEAKKETNVNTKMDEQSSAIATTETPKESANSNKPPTTIIEPPDQVIKSDQPVISNTSIKSDNTSSIPTSEPPEIIVEDKKNTDKAENSTTTSIPEAKGKSSIIEKSPKTIKSASMELKKPDHMKEKVNETQILTQAKKVNVSANEQPKLNTKIEEQPVEKVHTVELVKKIHVANNIQPEKQKHMEIKSVGIANMSESAKNVNINANKQPPANKEGETKSTAIINIAELVKRVSANQSLPELNKTVAIKQIEKSNNSQSIPKINTTAGMQTELNKNIETKLKEKINISEPAKKENVSANNQSEINKNIELKIKTNVSKQAKHRSINSQPKLNTKIEEKSNEKTAIIEATKKENVSANNQTDLNKNIAKINTSESTKHISDNSQPKLSINVETKPNEKTTIIEATKKGNVSANNQTDLNKNIAKINTSEATMHISDNIQPKLSINVETKPNEKTTIIEATKKGNVSANNQTDVNKNIAKINTSEATMHISDNIQPELNTNIEVKPMEKSNNLKPKLSVDKLTIHSPPHDITISDIETVVAVKNNDSEKKSIKLVTKSNEIITKKPSLYDLIIPATTIPSLTEPVHGQNKGHVLSGNIPAVESSHDLSEDTPSAFKLTTRLTQHGSISAVDMAGDIGTIISIVPPVTTIQSP